MASKKHADSKEESFRFATGVFMIVAFSCIIAALIFFENNDTRVGVLLLGFGIGMVAVTLWSYFHPFYPVLVGLLLYLSLNSLLIYTYTEEMLYGTGSNLLRYLLLGLVAIVYALYVGYKDWTISKNKI